MTEHIISEYSADTSPVTHLPHAIAPQQIPSSRRPEAHPHDGQHAHVRLPLVFALSNTRVRPVRRLPIGPVWMPREETADRDARGEPEVGLQVGKEVEEGECAYQVDEGDGPCQATGRWDVRGAPTIS